MGEDERAMIVVSVSQLTGWDELRLYIPLFEDM